MLDGVDQNIYCTDVDMQKSGAKIENINMQKWVNIITTVNNRSLDTYINGKLIKTKTFNNVIDTTAFNYGNIVITPNGGFGGYVSKVRYYPRYITPNEAWNIYKDGFGDAETIQATDPTGAKGSLTKYYPMMEAGRLRDRFYTPLLGPTVQRFEDIIKNDAQFKDFLPFFGSY